MGDFFNTSYPLKFHVSWYEVAVFLDELNARFKTSVPSGWRIDIPTKTQYTHAIRQVCKCPKLGKSKRCSGDLSIFKNLAKHYEWCADGIDTCQQWWTIDWRSKQDLEGTDCRACIGGWADQQDKKSEFEMGNPRCTSGAYFSAGISLEHLGFRLCLTKTKFPTTRRKGYPAIDRLHKFKAMRAGKLSISRAWYVFPGFARDMSNEFDIEKPFILRDETIRPFVARGVTNLFIGFETIPFQLSPQFTSLAKVNQITLTVGKANEVISKYNDSLSSPEKSGAILRVDPWFRQV